MISYTFSIFRKIINRLIRVRNMKIFLVVQSCITTSAVIYMMLQTSNLDEISKLEGKLYLLFRARFSTKVRINYSGFERLL